VLRLMNGERDVEACFEELPSASGSVDPTLAAREDATPEQGAPCFMPTASAEAGSKG